MGSCTRLSGAKFTLLARLGAACGTTNSQGLLLLVSHSHIMYRCPGQRLVKIDQSANSSFNEAVKQESSWHAASRCLNVSSSDQPCVHGWAIMWGGIMKGTPETYG
jgi:hypothetical protein